jgi:serine/threonine protein phosphatase PrpC
VADGHGGFDAARAGIGAVLEAAETLVGADEAALAAGVEVVLSNARAAVADALERVALDRFASRTALSVVAGRGHSAAVGTAGDTAAVRVGGRRRAKRLGRPQAFLGPWTEPAPPASVRLRPGERVVVCSDGLPDALGARWLQSTAALCEGLAGPEAARRLVDAALERGAADNVAVAVGPLAPA